MQFKNKKNTKNAFIKMSRLVQAEAPLLQADTCQLAVNHQTCLNAPVIKREAAHFIISMIVIILYYLWSCR